MIDWKKYKGYREVTAFPAVFSKERFGLQDLWHAAEKAKILFRGWPFIFLDRNKANVIDDGIETVMDLSSTRGHESFEMWQLRQSGLFFHRALMDEETYLAEANRGKVLDITHTTYHISEAIGSLWRLYQELGVSDQKEITIEFRYTGTADRSLVNLERMFAPSHVIGVCRSTEVVRQRRLPLSLWRASDADIASEIICEIFQRFNWIDCSVGRISERTHEFLAKPRF